MARRQNELFIGTEHINDEGRTIKHPALIKLYATVNAKKVNEKPLELIGLDIETDATKGDMKLLGFWDGEHYEHFTDNFINHLFWKVFRANKANKSLAYWNRLDSLVILKEFLFHIDPDDRQKALARFGKISGEYNKKTKLWEVNPVVMIDINGYKFGIMQAIRSSIQFFIYKPGANTFRKTWSFDIAQLYQSGLEKEATSRLDYYSKVDASAHIVDWDRFNTDADYKHKIVLRSNELDARACYDLGYIIQEDFKAAFDYYPRSLISQGSLARSAIVANIFNNYKHLDEAQANYAVAEDVKSIGIMNYYDAWTDRYGQDVMKDLYALFSEAYSGGYIEAIQYGYAKEGYYTDIASAYPGVIQNLYDLRDAKITHGTGTPPEIKNSYCFIRGTITIPKSLNFHSVTIKHPFFKDTNIRPTGTFRASYTLNERKYLEEHGSTFEDETWYNIKTTGKRSTLAKVCKNFIDLRQKFLKEKNSSQYMAKIAANSLYGILFEAVDTYSEKIIKTQETANLYALTLSKYKKGINLNNIKNEIKYWYDQEYTSIVNRWHSDSGIYPDQLKEELEHDGIFMDFDNEMDIFNEVLRLYNYKVVESDHEYAEVSRDGYRAGEFWNPLYASIITSETRLLMAKAAQAIESKGGKVILMMTDSLFWKGKQDMIPSEYVREQKTLGYFEKVEKVTDIVCLGSGRYGYRSNDYTVSKKRGLNAAVIHDENGIQINEFDWHKVLEIMKATNQTEIEMEVRTLVSPGLILGNKSYNFEDLGRIVEEERNIDAIVGINKRDYDPKLKNPSILTQRLVKTNPIHLLPGMTRNGIVDQTLPQLRRMMMQKDIITKAMREAQYQKTSNQNYSDKAKTNSRSKYQMLKDAGFTTEEATKMRRWSMERITKAIEDLK